MPETLGAVLLARVSGTTVALSAPLAVVSPPPEVAVTRTPRRWPMSSAPSACVSPVPTFVQASLTAVASGAQLIQT